MSRVFITGSADGLGQLAAQRLLTALMTRPARLVYLSSGMHRGGDPSVEDLPWRERSWNGSQAYSDSKLLDLVLCMAVARRWPDVLANAVDPGWVPTKMGGAGAPDELERGDETQAWLAVSDEPAAQVSGRYFYHLAERRHAPAADDTEVQNALLTACRELTAVALPDARAPSARLPPASPQPSDER